MQNGYVESFNCRMRDELLNEKPVLRHRPRPQRIAEWRQDFNTARPHSSLGYQTPAPSPEPSPQPDLTLRSIGASCLHRCSPAPYGVTETATALIAAG